MADHAAGDDIFVYTGGRAPQHVVNAIIDESVEEIDEFAFQSNRNLRSVVCHGRLLKVGKHAFLSCWSLQRVKMPGVKIIEEYAFNGCEDMTNVESDNLETVGNSAFYGCSSLQRVKMPKVKTIGRCSFIDSGVEDAEFGEDLEIIGSGAFRRSKLRRIAIPLKNGMFQWSDDYGAYTQFDDCPNLITVDLVGGIHKTVASLHLDTWRKVMNWEIQRINHIILPGTDPDVKTEVIRQWVQSVIRNIDRYKAEHRALLKEATALLELALWKAKLAGFRVNTAKKANIDVREARARKEARITSGADIVMKNVLPFLMMVE
jgi:hypothetical protein